MMAEMKLRDNLMGVIKMKRVIFLLISLFGLNLPVFAQNDGAACGAVGCMLVFYILFLLVMVGIGVTVIVLIFKFIKRDAIARGDDPSKAWLALLGLLGLLIYVLMRPQGNVFPCPSCGQNRMQGLPRCPHCGNQ